MISYGDPVKRIERLRSRLLLDYPWYGALALRLRVVAAEGAELGKVAEGWGLATDGSRLVFDPVKLATRPDAELLAGIAHEVEHCALKHPYRASPNTDWAVWNQATDYVVNGHLKAAGFRLWEGAYVDPRYAGMSAEQVYGILKRKPAAEDGGGAGDGQDGGEPQPGMDRAQPGKASDPADSGTAGPSGPDMTAEDWSIAAEQAAMVARKAGAMPGDVDGAIQAARRPVEDWRAILREFVENTVPSDYSWQSPNRAFLPAVFVPGVVRENMPRLAVAVDTSGSVSDADLAIYSAELSAILHESRPAELVVLYCDREVRRVDRYSPEDAAVELRAVGRGGTAFQPVFDALAADPDGEPAALVYFTDLEGAAPRDPGYPVLWVTTGASRLVGPFGRTVRVNV